MKTLIVYYSLEGNTKFAVDKIVEKLGAAQTEVLQLIPKKAYPDSGFKKFFWGGKSAVMKEVPELEPFSADFARVSKIILATPVWASTFAPPLRTFIRKYLPEITGREVSLVACSAGGNADKCFDNMKRELPGTKVTKTLSLIDPKTNNPEYNLKLIEEFCRNF